MSLLTVVTCLSSIVDGSAQVSPNPVSIAVKSYGVDPDLIRIGRKPLDFVQVTYPGQLQVIFGNVVGLNQVQEQPTFTQFYACKDRYYTLIMLDPDVPSRTNTSQAQVRHWHIGNIPGDDLAKGEPLAVYMGPMPGQGTGPHRYVFLVFRQKKKLVFTEPKILDTSGEGRLNFSIDSYVKKYNLKLIAANFFQTEYRNDGCPRGYEPVDPST